MEAYSKLLGELRDVRDFDGLHLSARLGRPILGARAMRMEVQALNEMAFYEDARQIAEELIRTFGDDENEVREAHGLIGRSFESEYLQTLERDAPDQNLLRQSFDAYYGVYKQDGQKALWHGVNALAH